MRFLVFRKGYHPKNNPEEAGGPESCIVGEAEAHTEADALERAFLNGFTSYPGQKVWVEKKADDHAAKKRA